MKNGLEGGIDCGGPCPALCEVGTPCTTHEDCSSGVCTSDICQIPACDDATRNGDETDVDCGGSCSECAVGEGCEAGADCVTGVCGDGACLDAACGDGTKNGDETDLDCGGSSCAGCLTDDDCVVDGDCQSDVCVMSACAEPSCSDATENGNETATDCGGGECSPCTAGEGCLGAADCISSVCAANVCQAASCTDLVENGSESDTDCGGGCPACVDGDTCGAPEDCVSGACAGGACGVWSIRSSSDSHDFLTNGTLAPDSMGGLFVAGHTASTSLGLGAFMLPGLGFYDAFLARLSPTGAVVWASRFGSTGLDTAYVVASNPATGRVAIAGTYSGSPTAGFTLPASSGEDGFVAVFDEAGTFQWARTLTGPNSDAYRALAFTSSGDVVVAGETGAINANGGGDVIVRRYNAVGVLAWEASITGPDREFVRGVAANNNGEVFATGSFGGDTGGAMSVGALSLSSGGGRDGFLLKLDGAGSPLWLKGVSNALQADGQAVTVLPNGDPIVAVSMRGEGTAFGDPVSATLQSDIVISRLSGSTGTPVWTKKHGSVDYDDPRALAITPGGDVLVGGNVGGAINFGDGLHTYAGSNDAFTLLLSGTDGATLASRVFGSSADESTQGVSVSSRGSLVIAGTGHGALDFGDGLDSKGGTQGTYGAFVASLGITL